MTLIKSVSTEFKQKIEFKINNDNEFHKAKRLLDNY